MMEDTFGLRDIILKRVSIDLLRSQEAQNIEEKLELRDKIRQLELSLQRRECEVEELQEVVRLKDRYRESYQEAQHLHFELGRYRFPD